MRKRIISNYFMIATLMLALFSSTIAVATTITENPLIWGKTTLQFAGPNLNETTGVNPFSDYRLDVVFTSPNGEIFNVPGYFAADGNAGETSAEGGTIWQVNFAANVIGEWSYAVSFVQGANIAAALSGGTSAGSFDGETGTFIVSDNDFEALDFKSKGKLEYIGEHFLQFQGNKEYFIKAGANSPEVFLEYQEFDNTPSDRTYPDFINDWTENDPTWKEGKGKGIIGVVNYLSSIDINGYYFLTMNAYGDGKKAWPWIHQDSLVRYDCSKLEQWDILFQHMNAKGVLVHFVLTETENEALFEMEEFGEADGFADSRKIYFREMVARYGYLPAVTWNVGEENGWAEGDGYHTANTDQQRKDYCDRLRELSYYDDHIAIHNGPSTDDYIFEELLGHESFTGPAFQWDFGVDIFDILYKWRTRSAEAGHKWVMSLDEPYVNPPTEDLNEWRTDNIWPTFMAGCAGIELYIGQGYDLTVQDYRTYEDYYNAMTVATGFFRNYLPFHALEPDTSFTNDAYTLRLNDSIFVLYMADANESILDLPNKKYKVEWFEPKFGGAPAFGTVKSIDGGNQVNIGQPLKNIENDWVCVLTEINEDQSMLDISLPYIDKTMEEGRLGSDNSDEIIVSIASGNVDSVWVKVEDDLWLDYTLVKNTDNTWKITLQLNDEAKALSIKHYQAVVGVCAQDADPVYINYGLDVIYNLNDHDYYYADNGMVIMEMESNPLLNHWVLADDEEGYTGEGYYYYDGPFLSEPVDTNVFEYYFYVSKAGDYQVAIHNFIPNNDYTENNDTWLQMDNNGWWKHFSHTNNVWNWETQLDDGDENFHDPIWDLEIGYHVLRIGGRSDKFYLNKIHIHRTNLKEQFVTDESLLESGKSDRSNAIISINKSYLMFNYDAGDIPDVSNKTVLIKNKGIGTLDDVTATCDAPFVSMEITGEGNSQKMIVSFADEVKDLAIGVHEYSILMNSANATQRELKVYFNIADPVGINTMEQLNAVTLKSTMVSNQLEFVSSERLKANVQIVSMNGQVVYSYTLEDIATNTIATDFLQSGVYIVRLNTDKGICNLKFIKS